MAGVSAAEFLARELGVAIADLEVVSVTAMIWSDASLGCPQPSMMYAQLITPGYLVVVQGSGETEYKVHTNENGSSAVVCGE